MERRIKNGLLIARVLAAVYVIFMFYGVYRIFHLQNMRPVVIVILSGLLVAFSLFSQTMIRRGRTTAAAWILILLCLMSVIAMQILSVVRGTSWIFGIGIGMACMYIASQMMDKRWAGWGVFTAILGGALCSSVDALLMTPYDFKFDASCIILSVVCVFFILLLVRQFKDFPINVKMLLVMSGSSAFVAIVLIASAYKVGLAPSAGVVLSNAGAATASDLLRNMVLISSLVVGISGGAALWLTRFITRPLTRVVEMIDIIAQEGDLSQTVQVSSEDEIGQLARSFNRMMEHFQELAFSAQRVANHDLTGHFQPKSGRDSLGIAFAEMNENLRTVIGELDSSVKKLNDASADLFSSARFSGEASSQITRSIQQIAIGTIHQADAVRRVAGSIDEMTDSIKIVELGSHEQVGEIHKTSEATNKISSTLRQVAGNVRQVKDGTAEAAATASDGARTIQEALEDMNRIKTKVGISAQKMQEMGEHSERIGAIVSAIEEIASQTNLLALNAAIEAARAGEQGKGFGVVSDEVRKLAVRSKAETSEISNLIKGIQKTIREAVASIEDGASEVENGVTHANEAGIALEKIRQAIEGVHRQAELAAATEAQVDAAAGSLTQSVGAVSAVIDKSISAMHRMTARVDEADQAINDIANVSDENSAAAEEVSASAEETTAQMLELANSAQYLAEMASDLGVLVAQFKMDAPQACVSENGEIGLQSGMVKKSLHLGLVNA